MPLGGVECSPPDYASGVPDRALARGGNGRYHSQSQMSKSEPQADVLVLGEHPAAYLAAALTAHKSKLRVCHATVPDEPEHDRLVLVNPALFDLHPLLEPLRRKLELRPVFGVQFLADDAATRSEHRGKSALTAVGSLKAARATMADLAEAEGVTLLTPKALAIHRLDETGIELTVGKWSMHPRSLIVAGILPAAQQKILGMPDGWGEDIVHRYTYVRCAGAKWTEPATRALISMSLNLHDELFWAWLIPGTKTVQLAVEQPLQTIGRLRPFDLLAHWVEVLRRHGVLNSKGEVPLDTAVSIDLPLAGALEHEGVANRTLLVGPAGGFYSACSEDIYPNCWSAVYAAEVMKKALKERHLQDALQPYRHRWRTTLGDYLRGPQQNLRFLLPLVYRNQVMTTRLTEAILTGKSVVR